MASASSQYSSFSPWLDLRPITPDTEQSMTTLLKNARLEYPGHNCMPLNLLTKRHIQEGGVGIRKIETAVHELLEIFRDFSTIVQE